MYPGSGCLTVAVKAAVSEWAMIAPAGTVIAVVIATPGQELDVYSPAGQNPAATYGALREVADSATIHG